MIDTNDTANDGEIIYEDNTQISISDDETETDDEIP